MIPQLRFPKFTDDWGQDSLGSVAVFSKGKGISKSDIIENGATECIRYGELYTVYSEVITEIFSKTNLDEQELVLSEENDVIIPTSGETQIDIATASCILKSGVGIGGDLTIIKSELNGVFLSYYLNNARKTDIAKLAQGISVVHLYSSQLAKLIINIPSPSEQTQIANFLTAVDERIELLKKKKKELEQYKKGIMKKIFSQELRFKQDDGSDFPDWVEKKLGEVAEIIAGKSKSKYINENGEYVIVDMGGISQEGKLIANKKTDYNKDFLKKDDLVMPKDDIGGGLIIGKVAIISQNNKYIFGDHIYKLTNINANSLFLLYRINSPRVNKDFRKKANGTAQLGLSKKEVENQKIEIPFLPEQQKIANFLSSIDKSIKIVEKEIEQSQQWKKGLLQKMFV